MMRSTLHGNIRKYFLFKLSHGSYYFTIIWIYFLMFPGNSIRQLGIIWTVAYIASFVFEIPSSYMADRWWHKQTLIAAKVVKALSTIVFLIGGNFWIFAIWNILGSMWYAFASGTDSAFMHETLSGMGKEKNYTKIMSRINGNIWLLSIGIIAWLPLLTQFGIKWPFIIRLGIDIIWLVASILFKVPARHEEVKKTDSPLKVIKSFWWTNFLRIAIFPALMMAFRSGEQNIRGPFLQFLWYPIAYIGCVLAGSKIIVYGISRIAHLIKEKISLKQLFIFEIFFFWSILTILASIQSPYLGAILIAVMAWYIRGRKDLLDHICLEMLWNTWYKATALSFVSQLWSVGQLIVVFLSAFVMNISYSLWFLCLWIGVVATGILWFLFLYKRINLSTK